VTGRDAAEGRPDPLLPNAWLVAKRELRERVRSRLFVVSTLLLAGLAVAVALTPLLLKYFDKGSTSTVVIVTRDDALAGRAVSVLSLALNKGQTSGKDLPFAFVREPDAAVALDEVGQGHYDAALIVSRQPSGGLDFQLTTGESISAERVQQLTVGAWGVAVFDWTAQNQGGSITKLFQIPGVDVLAGAGPSTGGKPLTASDYAARRIVGVVFVVLIFITLVIYGMWVAAGVVAEKSSRVMELLISAASPAQLVVGKVVGIGLAGFVQYIAIVAPAIVILLLEDRIATLVLGNSDSLTGVSLSVLSPGLLAAYGAFWILGFILYSLIYAAAGSLVSRPEDLQVLALPLSLVAIIGYFEAVMALSGGLTPFMRFSSYIPFWSPFVMLTRLTVGRVEPAELAVTFSLLVVAIAVVGVLAVRVYSAGVLLYGQRPGFKAIVNAVVNPPV